MTADEVTGTPRDPLFGRIERRAIIAALVLAVIAWLIPRGGSNAAAGVIGGAMLAGASYWAIKRGVGGLADTILATGQAPGSPVQAILMLVLRYAVLGTLGYLFVVQARLNPLGLLAGASVVAIAAAIEAVSFQARR